MEGLTKSSKYILASLVLGPGAGSGDALEVKPLVLQSLHRRRSLLGVRVEELPDEVLRLLRHHGVPVKPLAGRVFVGATLLGWQVELSSLGLLEDLHLAEAAERVPAL